MSHTKDEVIMAALEQYRIVLDEVARPTRYSSPKDGTPPSEIFVEEKREPESLPYTTGTVLALWLVSREAISPISLSAPEPSVGERRGRFYERGHGAFAVADDMSTVSLGWQVGPTHGLGVRFSVERDASGRVALQRPERLWIS